MSCNNVSEGTVCQANQQFILNYFHLFHSTVTMTVHSSTVHSDSQSVQNAGTECEKKCWKPKLKWGKNCVTRQTKPAQTSDWTRPDHKVRRLDTGTEQQRIALINRIF